MTGFESEFSPVEPETGIQPKPAEFTEPPELTELRGEYVAAIQSGVAEFVREAASRYRVAAEAVVTAAQGEAYRRAQIGLLIQTGLIYREAGKADRCREELQDALLCAEAEGFDDLVASITRALD